VLSYCWTLKLYIILWTPYNSWFLGSIV